jgi:hypothetical protein
MHRMSTDLLIESLQEHAKDYPRMERIFTCAADELTLLQNEADQWRSLAQVYAPSMVFHEMAGELASERVKE